MALPRSWRVRTVRPLLLLALAPLGLGCLTYGDAVSASVLPGTRALAPGAQALYVVQGQGASYWDAPPLVLPTQVVLEDPSVNTAEGLGALLASGAGPDGSPSP